MKDRFGRTIEYMRVSVTDRCDLRCRYCIPDGCEKVPMSRILTYEEIIRICSAASELGIRKIRVTGGEPFVRIGCAGLIRSIKEISGIDEVYVTTNGQSLSTYIDELAYAGIDGINISMDTLVPERFSSITGGGMLDRTLEAIGLSVKAGITTKVNTLIIKGFNEDEVTGLAAFAFDRGIALRFIEMMPVGAGDPSKGVPNSGILERLLAEWPDLEPDTAARGCGPAVYYSRPGVKGALGFISAMHEPFCRDCNRIRLTSQGQLKPCLCYEEGTDLRPYLSGSDTELKEALKQAIYDKPEAHCFATAHPERRFMSQIGG